MQKLEVVIESDSFNPVHEALRAARVGILRVAEVKTFDTASPPQGYYRGVRYPAGRECLMLVLIVDDHEVDAVVNAIRHGLDEFAEGYADITVQAVASSTRVRSSVWTRTRRQAPGS